MVSHETRSTRFWFTKSLFYPRLILCREAKDIVMLVGDFTALWLWPETERLLTKSRLDQFSLLDLKRTRRTRSSRSLLWRDRTRLAISIRFRSCFFHGARKLIRFAIFFRNQRTLDQCHNVRCLLVLVETRRAYSRRLKPSSHCYIHRRQSTPPLTSKLSERFDLTNHDNMILIHNKKPKSTTRTPSSKTGCTGDDHEADCVPNEQKQVSGLVIPTLVLYDVAFIRRYLIYDFNEFDARLELWYVWVAFPKFLSTSSRDSYVLPIDIWCLSTCRKMLYL